MKVQEGLARGGAAEELLEQGTGRRRAGPLAGDSGSTWVMGFSEPQKDLSYGIGK